MIHGHGGNIYALAQKLGCGPDAIVDVSSNINPLGPPPGLMEHLKTNLAAICALPEVDGQRMSAKMADLLGVDSHCVLAGAGTTQFIHTMFGALSSRRVLIAGPTYADYSDACHMHNLAPRFILAHAEDRFSPDLPLLAQSAGNHDTVVICNPNNPTGALISKETLQPLCRKHPHTCFVIDESYLPFVPESEMQSMVGSGLDNVIVLHSLSKIFRLPGLRIGFLIAGRRVVEKFQGILPPWRLNSMAQAAVDFLHSHRDGIAAFVRRTHDYINRERDRFHEIVSRNKALNLYPSCTSFVLIELPENETAARVCDVFGRERILVRNCSNFHGLTDRFIRIAMNRSEVNSKVAEILSGISSSSKKGKEVIWTTR